MYAQSAGSSSRRMDESTEEQRDAIKVAEPQGAERVLRPLCTLEELVDEFASNFDRDSYARQVDIGHPAYERASQVVYESDQAAFDSYYDRLPPEHFEPLIRDVFATPKS